MNNKPVEVNSTWVTESGGVFVVTNTYKNLNGNQMICYKHLNGKTHDDKPLLCSTWIRTFTPCKLVNDKGILWNPAIHQAPDADGNWKKHNYVLDSALSRKQRQMPSLNITYTDWESKTGEVYTIVQVFNGLVEYADENGCKDIELLSKWYTNYTPVRPDDAVIIDWKSNPKELYSVTPALTVPAVNKLMNTLDQISGMCVGEIAMGCKLDAEYIGQLIYEATGITSEELTKYCKGLPDNV